MAEYIRQDHHLPHGSLEPHITNADRIRAMTDEELYTFLNAFVTHQEDVWCPYKDDCGTLLGQGHRTMDCRDCIHEWLKKEVDG